MVVTPTIPLKATSSGSGGGIIDSKKAVVEEGWGEMNSLDEVTVPR